MARLNYRLGVVGVFQNSAGMILICERSNKKGAWQFPQGGMNDGEEPEAAILREIDEELGTKAVKIIKMAKGLTQYDFPKSLQTEITKSYLGQRHHWFLLSFVGNAEPDLAKSDGEFCNWQWVELAKCLDATAEWKKKAYEDGLKLLGLRE